jgi:hypothetical protein
MSFIRLLGESILEGKETAMKVKSSVKAGGDISSPG